MSTKNESKEQAPKTVSGKRRTKRRFTDTEKVKAVALSARSSDCRGTHRRLPVDDLHVEDRVQVGTPRVGHTS